MTTLLFIGILIASTLWILGGILIWPNYKRSENNIVGDFAKMLIWAGAGLAMMDIVLYQAKFIVSRVGKGWLMVISPIGALVKSVGIIYTVKVLFGLLEKYRKVTTRISVFIFSTFFAMLFYNRIAFAIAGKEAMLFPKGIGYYFDIWFFPIVLIPTIWLVAKSLKAKEIEAKIKGILVGMAFLLFIVNMQACGAAGVIKPIAFNWPTAIATTLIMIGLIYLSKKRRPEEILIPATSGTLKHTSTT